MEFVKVYTDDGITATNTKRRDGFKDMVEDALAGKIDLIITKSVSRFARNTIDSLQTVRDLKEKGVEIYFEKENIWTLDSKGELLITIMSSLAQEESRSISENTTWGKRKQFSDGKASVAFSTFLGYDRGENGEFVINEEQAKVVRLIYNWYLQAYSHYKIAEKLTELGIKTPAGKDKWYCSSVLSILKNEKYKGDALLQKEYTTDFLTKKRKKNNGEIPQYYVEGHHEGIVTPEEFDLVQAEILRRKEMGRDSGVALFSSTIKCGECGSWFGSKVWHSNDKYRRVIYQCNHKFKGKCKCKTPHLYEDDIKALFVKAANEVISEKDEMIANTKDMMAMVCDTTALEDERESYLAELNILAEKLQDLIAENSRVAQDQIEYNRKYNAIAEKYESTKEKYDEVLAALEKKNARAEQFKGFIATLENTGDVTEEFEEELWGNLMGTITVHSKDKIVFTFKNGHEVVTEL